MMLQILLLVGTKLQVIITKLGLRIHGRGGDVIKGTPVVEPGDDLFWFNRPHLILFLINFVLFLVFLSHHLLYLPFSHPNEVADINSYYVYATCVFLFLESQNAFQLAFFAWSTVRKAINSNL